MASPLALQRPEHKQNEFYNPGTNAVVRREMKRLIEFDVLRGGDCS